MIRAITSESHARSHRILIDHKDLELLIAKAAAENVEFRKPKVGAPGVTFKITFEDATEGSPAYRVGTKAIVIIVEDLMPATTPDQTNEVTHG